jgi:Zn-dependent protease
MPDAVGFTHITQATAAGGAEFAATFLSILFVLNVLLGTFNLLPVPPLDGHTGVTLLMSKSVGLRFLQWTSSQNFGLMGIVLAWVLYDRIFGDIFRLALALLYPGSRWG